MISYNEDTKQDVKLHLQEADNLKKQWFDYVFKSIDRLSEKVEATALKVEHERVEVLERLNKLREMLSADIKSNKADQTKQLEKVEERVAKMVDIMSVKVDGINTSEIRLQLDVYVQESADKIDKVFKSFESKTNTKIQTLNDVQIELKTRIKTYVVIGGLVVTAITTILSSLLGNALLKMIGNLPS